MGVRMVKCRNCGGSGEAKSAYGWRSQCKVCMGQGKVPDPNSTQYRKVMR